MTAEKEAAYKNVLSKAVKHGYSLLKEGEKGEVAVVETIKILETSPLFNAGIGAVYTFDGEHELVAVLLGANLGQGFQQSVVQQADAIGEDGAVHRPGNVVSIGLEIHHVPDQQGAVRLPDELEA